MRGTSFSGGRGDQPLQALYVFGADPRQVGLLLASGQRGREVSAEIEELLLQAENLPIQGLRQHFQAHHAQQTIDLIDGAVGGHPRCVFGDPAAVGQAGFPLVAAAGGDAIESNHRLLPVSEPRF